MIGIVKNFSSNSLIAKSEHLPGLHIASLRCGSQSICKIVGIKNCYSHASTFADNDSVFKLITQGSTQDSKKPFTATKVDIKPTSLPLKIFSKVD